MRESKRHFWLVAATGAVLAMGWALPRHPLDGPAPVAQASEDPIQTVIGKGSATGPGADAANPPLVCVGPAAEAMALWTSLHDSFTARGWGDRFSDYAAHSAELARIARLYQEFPPAVGACLRLECAATEEIHARAVLGLLLMTVREEGEPFLLDRIENTGEYFDRLFLAATLGAPRSLLPEGGDEAQTRRWKDLVMTLGMVEGQVRAIRKRTAEGRWPFLGGRWTQPANWPEDRPLNTKQDWDEWVKPDWYVSPAAAERFKVLALREQDSWMRYKMFMKLQFAAESGNREVARWLEDQYFFELRRGGGATGAIAYGVLRGLGPQEGVRAVTNWILEKEKDFPEDKVRYLTRAIEDVHGDDAWPAFEDAYWRIQDTEIRRRIIEEYFKESSDTAPPAGLEFLRREALGSASAAVRAAAMRKLAVGKYGGPGEVQATLYAGLDDPDPDVRAMAAWGTAKFEVRGAIDNLAALARTSTHPYEQWYTYQAIKEMAPETLDDIEWRPQE